MYTRGILPFQGRTLFSIVAVALLIIGSAVAAGAKYRVTSKTYSEKVSNNQACINEFGAGYAIADWNDIKAGYASSGSLTSFFNEVGMPHSSSSSARSLRVARGGREMYSSSRHYFITRHDHSKPSYYLAHDNIDNYLLSLGSWYGNMKVLCTDGQNLGSTPSIQPMLAALLAKTPPLFDTTEVSVKVQLPTSTSNLKLLSYEEKSVSGGKASAVVPDGYSTSMYLTDDQDRIYGMAMNLPGEKQPVVNARSTAITVVLTFPISWGQYGLELEQLINLLDANPLFQLLVDEIDRIMMNDPGSIMESRNDKIWTMGWNVVNDITSSRGADPGTGEAPWDKYPHAYIEDGPGHAIKIINEKYVPYGISSINLQTNSIEEFTRFSTRPWWVSGIDMWKTFSSEKVYYDHLGTGEYVTCLAKRSKSDSAKTFLTALLQVAYPPGLAQVTAKDIAELMDTEGLPPSRQMRINAELKGNIIWHILMLCRALDFVPLKGDIASAVIEIVADMANEVGSSDVDEWEFSRSGMVSGGVKGTEIVTNYLKDYHAIAKAKSFARKLLSSKMLPKSIRVVGGGSQNHVLSKLSKGAAKLSKVLVIPDVINAVGFVSSSLINDDEACFKITQDAGGEAQIEKHTFIDCNGEVDGLAILDKCDVCVGGNTGVTSNCTQDCNGVWGGTATIDACGVCGGDGSSCSNDGTFKVTADHYATNIDLNAVCRSQFGSLYRLADWDDIVYHYNDGMNPDHILGSSTETASATVTRSGQHYYGTTRHYFATRHNHVKPSHYLSHANINNHLFDLGSWTSQYRVLCYKDTVAPPTCGPDYLSLCTTPTSCSAQGGEWTGTECVAHQCSTRQEAGDDEKETHTYNMGTSTGSFQFEYYTRTQRDRIVITQGGSTIHDTGCVGERKEVTVTLNGTSSNITVDVYPNCNGGTGTLWDYTISCP